MRAVILIHGLIDGASASDVSATVITDHHEVQVFIPEISHNLTHIVDPKRVEEYLGPAPVYTKRIRFGMKSTGNSVDELEFGTQAELDAYMNGVCDMDGWTEYQDDPDVLDEENEECED